MHNGKKEMFYIPHGQLGGVYLANSYNFYDPHDDEGNNTFRDKIGPLYYFSKYMTSLKKLMHILKMVHIRMGSSCIFLYRHSKGFLTYHSWRSPELILVTVLSIGNVYIVSTCLANESYNQYRFYLQITPCNYIHTYLLL